MSNSSTNITKEIHKKRNHRIVTRFDHVDSEENQLILIFDRRYKFILNKKDRKKNLKDAGDGI